MSSKQISSSGKGNDALNANLCSINISGMSERSRFCIDQYCMEKKLDVLAVQEIGTHNKESLQISNMDNMLDGNTAKNNGCALYVNKRHYFKQLNITISSKEFDYVWALVVIYGKKYILGTAYVKSDNTNLILTMLDMIEHVYIHEVTKHKALGVILMGDFNARHKNWGNSHMNKNGQILAEELDVSRFNIHHPIGPSFLCTNGNSTIDLFITSVELSHQISSCWTDDTVLLFSGAPMRGHVPVHVRISVKDAAVRAPITEKMDLEKMDWEAWTDDLEDLLDIGKIEILSQMTDPYPLWQYVIQCIDKVSKDNAPKKNVCRHSKPYWTTELTVLAKRYRSAQKRWNTRNTDINKVQLEQAKEEFDTARHEACRKFIIKNTKDLNISQTRQFWKNFNKLFGKSKDNKIEILEYQGEVLTTDEEKEGLMYNTFFEGLHLHKEIFDESFHASVVEGYSVAKSMEFTESSHNNESRNANSEGNYTDHCRYNEEIDEAEVRYTLKYKQSTGKSFDEDGVHPIMLSHIGPNGLTALTKLFNLCLSSGLWPWNTAEVIFLKKEGKQSYNDPGAYRPISITSYIGKVLEKILVARLEKYLYGEGLIDATQEGFTKGRNTIRYLNRLTTNIRKDIEKKLTVACLFLDFEKAFDSVWKKGLIMKLFRIGINGRFLALIDNFLSSRKVRIHVNEYIGVVRSCLEVGLPQGSVLSPILFKFFIMDLGKDITAIKPNDIFKFADDGTFKVSDTSWSNCRYRMENVLTSLDNWCKKWRLVMNCKKDKTEIVVFNGKESTDNGSTPQNFAIGNKTVCIVKKSKVLGLLIDEKLKFNDHSEMVFSQLNVRWITICKHSNRNWGFSQRVLVCLLKTLFLPKLYYAGHIWITPNNLRDIEKLWYKTIKAAIGAVFNVKQTLAEVIIGLPPLMITNSINKVKHYLKLNIQKTLGDQSRADLSEGDNNSFVMKNELKSTYKFLQWKLDKYDSHFNEQDKGILQSRDTIRFTELSSHSCKYSKKIIQCYVEELWQKQVNNQYFVDGCASIPIVSCDKLEIPINTYRDIETLLLSHFYDNNLMNSFLYRIGHKDVTTPMCPCKGGEQTPYHCFFECNAMDKDIKKEFIEEVKIRFPGETSKDHITLLNMSRDKVIMELMIKITVSQKDMYRKKIILTKKDKSADKSTNVQT